MTDVQKFRKKPVVVEMIRWDGSDEAKWLISRCMQRAGLAAEVLPDESLNIWVAKSRAFMNLPPGDWAVIEPDGSGVYPCTAEQQAATYEAASDPGSSGTSSPDLTDEEADRLADMMIRLADRPPIVCLCGSTRFMDAFHEAGWQETLAGKIVLSVGVAKHVPTADGGHVAEALGPDVVEALDELHKRKIDLADEVLVVSDETGYFGESTRSEIEYAYAHGKPVRYREAAAAQRAFDLGLIPPSNPSPTGGTPR